MNFKHILKKEYYYKGRTRILEGSIYIKNLYCRPWQSKLYCKKEGVFHEEGHF